MSIILSPATWLGGGRSTRCLGRAAEVVRISGKDVVRIYGTDTDRKHDFCLQGAGSEQREFGVLAHDSARPLNFFRNR
jgi:endonuclease YncB( thermonuclease family)